MKYYTYKARSNENIKNVKKIKIVLCAAACTASHQHGLEAYTVHGRSGNMLKNDKAVINPPAFK